MMLKRRRLIFGTCLLLLSIPVFKLCLSWTDSYKALGWREDFYQLNRIKAKDFVPVIPVMEDNDVTDDVRQTTRSAPETVNSADNKREFCNITYSEKLDLMKHIPPSFSPDYKNPCWHQQNGTLLCMPYFFLIGAAKCGTTDLYHRISLHPEFRVPTIKEPNWLSSTRFYQQTGLEDYAVTYFKYLAHSLSIAAKKRKTNLTRPIQYITGDSSVSTMTGAAAWQILPENVGLNEPAMNNPEYIYHMNPNTKIIMMVRNPVDRLWSEYLAFSNAKVKSPAIFHKLVTHALSMYRKCLESATLRSCMYNRTLFSLSSMTEGERDKYPTGCHRPSNILNIRRGVYHVFLGDYLKVFPRNQVLVQRLEDHGKDAVSSVKNVFKFLDMSPMSTDRELRIQNEAVRNSRKPRDRLEGSMWSVTRRLLYQFYRPHNQKMAKLMQDSSYNYGPGPG